jgi:hypothetical protein
MSVVMASIRELLPFLILAAVGLALLLYWTRRNGHDDVTIEQFSRAQEAVDALIGDFSMGKRIFEVGDMKFISRHPSLEARRVFLVERKALAISWLRHTRRQLAYLMDLHLKLASYTYHPNPRSDLRLWIEYQILAFVCESLVVFVCIRGPFQLGTVIGYALREVNELCAVFSLRLEDINPARLGPGHRTNVA